MPDDLKDNDPSDFDLALEKLEFVSHKARLIHQIEVISRSLPQAGKLHKIRLQQEILLLQQKIKDLENHKLDRRAGSA